MLNIKQAKPGVSGPEATRASLQGSRESPPVYMAGWGRRGGDVVCKISPAPPKPLGPRDGWGA